MIRKLLALGVAAAAGYSAARALLERDLPEETPPPVRERLEHARSGLQRARDQAREVFAAARQASDEATRDLLADHHRRTGRTSGADQPPTRTDTGLLRSLDAPTVRTPPRR